MHFMYMLQVIGEALDLFWTSAIGIDWVISIVRIKWSGVDTWMMVVIIHEFSSV